MWSSALTSRILAPFPTTPVFLFGDSKTMELSGGGYARPLRDLTQYRRHPVSTEILGTSGATAAIYVTIIDASLAGVTETGITDVLVNLGANDVISLPIEGTWKANMAYLLDAFHAKWPAARVFVIRPWKRDEAADCNTLATWISDLVSARSRWAFLGPDERTFLEGGDDGATYTSDGTHPNGSGYVLTAQQWKTVLDY